MDDPRTVAHCLVITHDGGASSEQLAHALGWPAARVNEAVSWLLGRDLISVVPSDDPEWTFGYVRQSARTAPFLDAG